MKRIAVFTVMLVASMLLTSCLSLSQATVNPGVTATPGIPDTGDMDATGMGTQVGTAAPVGNQGGLVGTVVGTMVPFVPDTGEFDMEGTPDPVGTAALSSNGLVFPNAGTPMEGIGTSMAGTPSAPFANEDMSDLGSGTGVSNTGAQESLVRLSGLLSYSLTDSSGASLGQVTDFVINIPQARVSYVVVNINNRQVLAPWSVVSAAGTSGFGFSGTSEQLNSAPTFETSTLDFDNQNWDQGFSQYWSGASPVTGTQVPGGQGTGTGTGAFNGAGQAAILASQLLRIQVVAPGLIANQIGTAVPGIGNVTALGQVQDALVSQTSGAVPWVLVSLNNNFINLNNRLIPVPFPALGTNLDLNGLLLTLNQNLLGLAPNLDSTNLPDLLGPGWDQQFFQFWNNNGFNNPGGGQLPNLTGTAQP